MNNQTVSLMDFYGHDDISRFADAMSYLRAHPYTTLIVPPGTYTLTTERARAAQKAVMNGEYTENPQDVMFKPGYPYSIGINFAGQIGTRFLAHGATFLIDGFMEPFSLTNCEDVELAGFSVDCIKKPFCRGWVTEICEAKDNQTEFIVKLDENCPIMENTPLMRRHLLWNPDTSSMVLAQFPSVTYIDPYHMKVVATTEAHVQPGFEFYMIISFHSRPIILVEYSKNIRLTDITIHSQCGMGVTGNRCENVTITRLNVVPTGDYHVSTNSDATHFVSTTGVLRYEDCTFIGQGDDFTNVHTYFHTVIRKDGQNAYCIQEQTPDGTHTQSLDYPDVGDQMELVSHSTLQTLGVYTVQHVMPMPNQWMCRIVLDRPLPEDTEGLMLADITRLPRLEVIGCRAESHFARSVLIKCRDALVENCSFRNVQGPAIVAAAESWWYEGVCPANVVIRGNYIENCACFWGEAAGIVVKADCSNPAGQSIHNIVIENNVIKAANHPHGIFLRNVENAILRGNKIETASESIKTENCVNIQYL